MSYRWLAGIALYENLAIEFRAHRRNDIDRLEAAGQKRDHFDARIRVSWRVPLLEIKG